MDFSKRLRTRREDRRLTREQLAEITGIHDRTITAWETEGREPRVGDLRKLAEALDTTIGYLVGETDDPTPSMGKNVENRENQSLGKVPILAPSEEAPLRFRTRGGKPLSQEQIEKAKRSIDERLRILEEKEQLIKLRSELDDLQSDTSS